MRLIVNSVNLLNTRAKRTDEVNNRLNKLR